MGYEPTPNGWKPFREDLIQKPDLPEQQSLPRVTKPARQRKPAAKSIQSRAKKGSGASRTAEGAIPRQGRAGRASRSSRGRKKA